MAAPVLTPAQIEQLEKERDLQQGIVDTFSAAVPAKEARADELEVADSGFKVFFDYYNDDIIVKYDTERQSLDGLFIVAPITEADILAPANTQASRTTPTLPDTDIIRIAEFDGGGTSSTEVNETQHIADQAVIEQTLQTGQTGTTPTLTATSLTASALTPTSTTLDMLDATGPMSFTVGDEFVVLDGGTDAALVRVDGIIDNAGGDPPYDITLDITLVIPPAGTISSGADTEAPFTGFTDSERDTKTASDPNLQPLMDSLITSLQARLADRQARLAEQIAAIDANQDPDAVSELAQAKTDDQTSDSFITSYLGTTDISDTGLTSLSNERSTRGGQITTRIGQITTNYTGQTENYYDRRYQTGNDRGNTARGTLRLQRNAAQGAVVTQGYADEAQVAVDAINALLA